MKCINSHSGSLINIFVSICNDSIALSWIFGIFLRNGISNDIMVQKHNFYFYLGSKTFPHATCLAITTITSRVCEQTEMQEDVYKHNNHIVTRWTAYRRSNDVVLSSCWTHMSSNHNSRTDDLITELTTLLKAIV